MLICFILIEAQDPPVPETIIELKSDVIKCAQWKIKGLLFFKSLLHLYKNIIFRFKAYSQSNYAHGRFGYTTSSDKTIIECDMFLGKTK